MKEFTPFSMNRKVVTTDFDFDPDKAVEITPVVRFGVALLGAPIVPAAPNISPNHQVDEPVEKPADPDPKAASSSVTGNVSPSPSDTVENGPNATDSTNPVHPSSLSENLAKNASAEKETNPLLQPPTMTG